MQEPEGVGATDWMGFKMMIDECDPVATASLKGYRALRIEGMSVKHLRAHIKMLHDHPILVDIAMCPRHEWKMVDMDDCELDCGCHTKYTPPQ